MTFNFHTIQSCDSLGNISRIGAVLIQEPHLCGQGQSNGSKQWKDLEQTTQMFRVHIEFIDSDRFFPYFTHSSNCPDSPREQNRSNKL